MLAAGRAPRAAITLAAGVWADRLPRHLVLVAVAGDAISGAGGRRRTARHRPCDRASARGLAVVYGLADGFVLPASQGLIPAVVSAVRLQQANALLGLSRSVLGFVAPALGGVLVTLGSPGSAILLDAASFAVAAVLLVRVAIDARDDQVEPEPFLRELREGWKTVPAADVDLDDDRLLRHRQLRRCVALRARAGGRQALPGRCVDVVGAREHVRRRCGRRRSARTALAAEAAAARLVRRGDPVRARRLDDRVSPTALPVLLASQFVTGSGLAIHLALWFTVFQQQVPEAARSRVSSYDALGSFVLIPLGTANPPALAGVLSADERCGRQSASEPEGRGR